MDDRNSSDRSIIGGSGGNTSGTGGPELSGAGAAGMAERDRVGQDGETETRARDGSEAREGLSAGEDSIERAIGERSGISGSGGAPASSGRSSSEGNERPATPPDPGDPGGMGGVRATTRNAEGRPPGGGSPIDPQESSQD